MPKERRRVIYSGRVQGVGFRFTSQRLARGFAVSGQVRNLPDGRVEVLAEGEPEEVSGLLDAIRGELGDKMTHVQVDVAPVGDPPLSGFSIRY